MGALVLAGLATTRFVGGYLLFHVLTEMFSVVVSAGIFMLAWNSRRYFDNNYLLLVGIAYLFVGALDLLHTLAYSGMGVFPGAGPNPPTQLWVAARSLEVVTLLIAPVFLRRRLPVNLALLVYLGASASLVAAVVTGVFPTCFVPGVGLTPFKQVAEYVFALALLVSLVPLWRARDQFEPRVHALVTASIGVTVASEVAFATYAGVDDVINMSGHLLKIVSYYLLYDAIIATGLRRPFSLLFQDLMKTQEALLAAQTQLEHRVAERTSDLHKTVRLLETEVRERAAAEEQVRTLLNMLPGVVVLVGPDHRVRFANNLVKQSFDTPEGQCCYQLLHGNPGPCSRCPVRGSIEATTPHEWEWLSPAGRTYEIRGFPFTDSDGSRLMLELGVDITERRRLEREVIDIGERERQRIGQDLHDALGQTLTGISYLSAALAQSMERDGIAQADAAQEIRKHAKLAIQQARNLARGLVPVEHEEEGLEHALRDLASTVTDTFNVPCRFECPNPVLLPDATASTHLFRVAQEAVTNAIRHARAGRIDITLAREDGRLMLFVDDDGPGLPDPVDTNKSSGMRIMSYRARMIGGSLSVRRSPVGGVRVECALPLPGAHT